MALREYISNNFWWKLLSLFLATLIWLNIRTNYLSDIRLSRPGVPPLLQTQSSIATGEFVQMAITVVKAPGALQLYRLDPPTVNIVVRGEVDALRELTARRIRPFVDVTDIAEPPKGESPRGVAKSVQVYTPPGVALVKVEPAAVMVERIPPPEPLPTLPKKSP